MNLQKYDICDRNIILQIDLRKRKVYGLCHLVIVKKMKQLTKKNIITFLRDLFFF